MTQAVNKRIGFSIRGETSYSSAHSSHWAEPSFWAQLSSARQIQFLKKLSSAQLAKLNLPIQLGSAQLAKLNLPAQLILWAEKMSQESQLIWLILW